MQNILSPVMQDSFMSWLSSNAKYKKYKKEMNKDMFAMVFTAFDYMDNYKPATYNLWFVKNSIMFKHIPQKQKILVHELVHYFLVDYIRGRFGKNKKERKVKT